MDKESKILRTLDLYVRLSEGKLINKEEEARRFGVNIRSLQRDIDDIRTFLAERSARDGTDNRSVVFDRTRKGYYIKGSEGSCMSNPEILAVCKILLESRAFTKHEINIILDKLIQGCVPQENIQLVSELISNEKFHYVELNNKSSTNDIFWELGEEIKEQNVISVKYERATNKKGEIKRTVVPVAILFSEYYFYLIAYILERDEKGNLQQKYDYPAIMRVDRITSFKETDEKFRIAYKDRFEEGEFRKRIQFMYGGKLQSLVLRYTGVSLEAVLDRLPTARVKEKTENGTIIEAEVFGEGIMMWLLSQGDTIEVLRPSSLRQKMKEKCEAMLALYQGKKDD